LNDDMHTAGRVYSQKVYAAARWRLIKTRLVRLFASDWQASGLPLPALQ